jgi:hypothetical protein
MYLLYFIVPQTFKNVFYTDSVVPTLPEAAEVLKLNFYLFYTVTAEAERRI